MSKKVNKPSEDNMSRLNRINPVTNGLFNALFVILALVCFTPIIFIFIISITDNNVIKQQGYQFFVTAETFSSAAYDYLWSQRATILQALWVSVYVTVLGTVIGVTLTALMGYVLSRREHKLNNFLTILIFIPMVFGGGMAATYVVNSQILHLSDTMWVLILPLAVSSFNITISRTFFRTTIPDSIIESARIDGASQWTVFFRIVLPISKPVLATIGLFLAFGYWNDWFQAKLPAVDAEPDPVQHGLFDQESHRPAGRQRRAAERHARRVCPDGHCLHCGRAHRLRLPLLPEVLHLRPDRGRREGLSLENRTGLSRPGSGRCNTKIPI